MRWMAHTVLIVDDHEVYRTTVRALLESEGFTVVGEAADGEEALEETCRLQPELVLLDICLPGLNGFEVASRISSSLAPPAVVLTSSRDSVDYGPLVRASGARGFVPKAELSGDVLLQLLG
jgi:DNA-binding NarL/FixJ family response regulator